MNSKSWHETENTHKTTLGNALRIVTSEMPHALSSSINICIGTGSRHESNTQTGISHFIEHMLFKGTNLRATPWEISSNIESTGGIMNASTEREMTVYWCKVTKPYFAQSLNLLTDMIRNSLFTPPNIENERLVLIEELNMTNDYPEYKVEGIIDEMLWPNHPLVREIGGTKESILNITRADMMEYWINHYNPSNVVISVAGNITHHEVLEHAQSLYEDWEPKITNPPEPVTYSQSNPRLRVDCRSTEQVHLSIAFPAFGLKNPDRYALDLLSVILGEGMSSRLFTELREIKGLAYDIHSEVIHFTDTGAVIVTAGVAPKNVYEASQNILSQINHMKDSISEEELEKAKRMTLGRLTLNMEDSKIVSGLKGAEEVLLGQIQETNTVIRNIMQITIEDVQRVTKELLITEKINMAVVGPYNDSSSLKRSLKL